MPIYIYINISYDSCNYVYIHKRLKTINFVSLVWFEKVEYHTLLYVKTILVSWVIATSQSILFGSVYTKLATYPALTSQVKYYKCFNLIELILPKK